MAKNKKIKSIAVFENEPVRRVWDAKKEKWFFSVVDVVRILTESVDAGAYWRKLKERLLKEGGNETVTKCHGLKMIAPDGKMRLTDVADTETMFRLIQSIPSPKAEPFKLWLAKVGYERLQETANPELAVNRARKHWLNLGRSSKWIEQRMRGQEIRNKLTDYWAEHGIEEDLEYAKLTDIIHQEWANLTTSSHKQLKGLKGHNLRDHMTDEELLFTALAEMSTRGIAEKDKAEGFGKNAVAGRQGGQVANRAKEDFEKLTGQKVVSGQNFLSPQKEVKILNNKKEQL
ncbi:MAG: hypothetical protein AUJ36_00025 [Parcubacteria group bacterium CG1_02_41_26]|nr:MAG: hypothetical protein AUJ36_00025 [Parcubacteria group bacterium CG1_02_41_26]